MFLGVSVLAGALVAGLAVPFAALAGVSGVVISDSVDSLPAYLDTKPEAMRTTIYLSDGSELAKLYDENREILPSLDSVSVIMRQAQIDIEDSRFYEHGAMDLKGTLRAFLSNAAGGETQGGSSITQQYVKQVRIEQAIAQDDAAAAKAVQAPTLSRKIEEMRYAIAIEKRFTKDEILLRYLNIVFYGHGAYGVEAAAMHYFGVHAKDLNLVQSAMLAGLVQNPNLNPKDYPEEAIARRNVVLDAMLKQGSVEKFLADGTIVFPGCETTTTPEGQAACDQAKAGRTNSQLAQAVVAQAKATGFDDTAMKVAPSGCVGVTHNGVDYSNVCHFIEQSLYQDPSFGATRAARESAVKRGGFEVYTTIRPEFQDAAQAGINVFSVPTDPVITTINEVQPGTGAIWAMAQNRPYGLDPLGDNSETSYIYSASKEYGGVPGYQAGSTFKSFTALAAIDQGIPPSYKINSPSSMDLSNRRFTDCDGHPNALPVTGGWKVSGGMGNINMYQAAGNSVNTYFAQLILQTGPCAAARMAKAMGVERGNGADLVTGDPQKLAELDATIATEDAAGKAAEAAGDPATAAQHYANENAAVEERPAWEGFADKPSFTLGVADVTPLSMAGAFATYGARGKACTPSIVSEIKNKDGQTVKNYNLGTDNCRDSGVRPEVIDGLNDVLKYVTTSGLGSNIRMDWDRDQGTKTGTTEYNDNVWSVTYTPEIAISCNVSSDTGKKGLPFWDTNGDGRIDKAAREGSLMYRTLPSGRYMQGWSYTEPPVIINAALAPVKDLIPKTPFTRPTAEILRGTPSAAPDTKGSPDEVQQRLQAAGYTIVQSSVYNPAPSGTYLSTTCEQYRGGTCTMIYSKGPRPIETPPR